jgi:4-carboxymuconolactone decarboxylase
MGGTADSELAGMPGSRAESIRRREELVLGKSPRIAPLDTDAIADAAVEHTRRIRQAVGSATPVSASTIPELVATLLCHPDLFQRVAELSIQLQGSGVLAPRDRQLAILRTAWLCQAPYAWGEHVKHSKRIGFSTEEIERVTQGSACPEWREHERALLCAVEELYEGAMISDPTWECLSRRLDDKQLFELPVLVGQFTTIAYFQNALRLRPEGGNAGLRAR